MPSEREARLFRHLLFLGHAVGSDADQIDLSVRLLPLGTARGVSARHAGHHNRLEMASVRAGPRTGQAPTQHRADKLTRAKLPNSRTVLENR